MEKKNKEMSPVVKEVRESLGRDYHRVLTWYHIMHPHIKRMRDEHYQEMAREWKLCKAVEGMIEIDEESSLSTCTVEEQYLERTYRFFTMLFNGDKLIQRNDSEKRAYIADCMAQFTRQTSTETLHKNSISLLKMSMEDIQFDSTGNAIFDSRNASVFIGSNIQSKSKSMRWVASSEDGISRILEKYGLSQVIAFMGEQGKTEEDNATLLSTKENIFLRGITDIASGKHYMCSTPSASSTRHADFPFVEASTRIEVYNIWCEITGFKNMKELLHGLGTKVEVEKLLGCDVNDIPEFKTNADIVETKAIVNGKTTIVMVFRENDKIVCYKINLAKFKARIAMRGSNSFDTYQTVQNPNVLWKLKHPNVDYVRDASGTTRVPFKGITSPGVLEMKNPDGTITTERV